jgi:hypothetical protein
MVYKIKLVLVARIGEGEDVQKQRRIYREEEEGQQDGEVREKHQEISFTTISQSYCVCFVKKKV